MYITSLATGHPPHHYNQAQLLEAIKKMWMNAHHNPRRVDQLHKAVQVKERFLALPMEEYEQIENFTESNDHFINVGTDVAEQVVSDALSKADLTPQDVDAIFFVSVTGVATPSIDAKLVNRLGFRSDIKRIPIFGLGCVAGAAGLARVHDYLKAYPKQVALLVSVELCSLTLQPKDLSVANLIASGLFGDGGSCVVGVGNLHEKASRSTQRPHPSVLCSKSRLYSDTEDVMGWKIGADGFKVILKATVPQLAEAHLRTDVDAFLAESGLSRSDITHWVCHTGGPKVLQAFENSLELSEGTLHRSWDSLQAVGNLSSSSVLFVLKDTMENATVNKGDYGLLLAMGPGFCCEMVLLQW
jgi:alkylresorcinol/alkylpyrone synthase